MINAFYCLSCIVLAFGSIYLGFKIIEKIGEWKASKYKTSTAHFLSDLYKLRVKWADLGEMGFCESLDNLIKFHGTINPEKRKEQPLTSEALSTEIMMKNQIRDEFVDVLKEYGVIETEFKG